jgi:hypothetical protein
MTNPSWTTFAQTSSIWTIRNSSITKATIVSLRTTRLRQNIYIFTILSLVQKDVRPEVEGTRKGIRKSTKAIDGNEKRRQKWQTGGGGDQVKDGHQAEQAAKGQKSCPIIGHHWG